jgi:hypothetical protein
MHNENKCPFDIWAPGHRTSINNKAFSSYAMHQQKIEDVINFLAEAKEPECIYTQTFIFQRVDLDSDTLTTDEVKYIEREVSRRRCLR